MPEEKDKKYIIADREDWLILKEIGSILERERGGKFPQRLVIKEITRAYMQNKGIDTMVKKRIEER